MGETLDHNREMLANRRFGQIGLLAMPYFMFLEYLAPIVEVAGYVLLPIGWVLGLVELPLLLLFLGVAFAYGLCLSLATLLLEALSFHRYRDVRQMLRLAGVAVREQLGLRQLHRWWRLVALITWRGRPPSWHRAPRQGFRTIAAGR